MLVYQRVDDVLWYIGGTSLFPLRDIGGPGHEVVRALHVHRVGFLHVDHLPWRRGTPKVRQSLGAFNKQKWQVIYEYLWNIYDRFLIYNF